MADAVRQMARIQTAAVRSEVDCALRERRIESVTGWARCECARLPISRPICETSSGTSVGFDASEP